MASAITSLITIAIMLAAMFAVTKGALSSVDLVSVSWKAMSTRSGEAARTYVQAKNPQEESAFALVTVANQGQVALRGFPSWDLVLQYYTATGTYYIKWMPYTTAANPGDNQWTVKGIYLNASLGTPEVYEPGILNPGEEMVIKAKPSPPIGPKTTNCIIVATPNGVATSVVWVR